jgi:hypothetical protein
MNGEATARNRIGVACLAKVGLRPPCARHATPVVRKKLYGRVCQFHFADYEEIVSVSNRC